MPPKGTSKERSGKTKYRSKQPDSKGLIRYTREENATWHDLITRQVPMLPGRACPQWIGALNEMNFPTDRIPQLGEVSAVLREHTGWSVVPVPALIGFTEFFSLLAGKQFPVATFIRSREDFDYIQEPDVFHEVFGHTPPLTDSRFSAFVGAYGEAGLAADPKDHAMLAPRDPTSRKVSPDLHGCVNLANRLSLDQTYFTIAKAGLFVTCQNGLSVLAGATETEMIVLDQSIEWSKRALYRHENPHYRFTLARGQCDIYCAVSGVCPVYGEFRCIPGYEQVLACVSAKLSAA